MVATVCILNPWEARRGNNATEWGSDQPRPQNEPYLGNWIFKHYCKNATFIPIRVTKVRRVLWKRIWLLFSWLVQLWESRRPHQHQEEVFCLRCTSVHHYEAVFQYPVFVLETLGSTQRRGSRTRALCLWLPSAFTKNKRLCKRCPRYIHSWLFST